jgi:deoxyribodipyrimidine photo-lyase
MIASTKWRKEGFREGQSDLPTTAPGVEVRQRAAQQTGYMARMLTLRTTFSGRDDLARYVATEFPFAVQRGASLGQAQGGRKAGLGVLASINPARYAGTHRYVEGGVTRLGPYLRHGLVSLAEVRDRVRDLTPAYSRAEGFLRELARRDYCRRVYERAGARIWEDLEPYKTGFRATDYEWDLPWDVATGNTGHPCIDGIVRDLVETGYLHHRRRTWFAAWLVHWKRVRWQAGAQFFLTHLLDGDPASNNLSWQWVASTFSNKPYFFTQANFERYGGAHCEVHVDGRGDCPFDASYDDLTRRLFGRVSADLQTPRNFLVEPDPVPSGEIEPVERAVVWLHDDALALDRRMAAAAPGAPLLYVFDEKRLRALRWSLKRIAFVYESALEAGATIVRGPIDATLAEFAAGHGAERIVTRSSPDPWIAKAIGASSLPVVALEPEPFVRLERKPDLRRFEPYWRGAQFSLLASWERERPRGALDTAS